MTMMYRRGRDEEVGEGVILCDHGLVLQSVNVRTTTTTIVRIGANNNSNNNNSNNNNNNSNNNNLNRKDRSQQPEACTPIRTGLIPNDIRFLPPFMRCVIFTRVSNMVIS